MTPALKQAGSKIYQFFTSFPDLNQSIGKAYRSMEVSERVIFLLFIICYVFSSILIVYNLFYVRYANIVSNLLFPPAGAAGFLLLYFCCVNTRLRFPRLSYFFLGILYMIIFIYCMFLTCGAAMLTPSTHLLNYQLLHWDLALGFNQLPLVIWADKHTIFHHILNWGYQSWGFQLALVCPVLALCKQYKQIRQWTVGGIIAILIVATIYYVYPSLPPASVYSQYHFDSGCYECISRFYLLHAYKRFAFTQCGLIVFPSCHVIYALFNTWAFRHVKWILYPLIALNIVLIASTLLLGMHFLVDVLGACVVFAVCQWIAHKVTQRDHTPDDNSHIREPRQRKPLQNNA